MGHFKILEGRLLTTENRQAGIESSVRALNGNVSQVKNKVSTLETHNIDKGCKKIGCRG